MFARLIAAPIAFGVSLIFLGTSPAVASTRDCAATAAQLRTAAATAEPAKARKALANIRTGEALCAADNAFEAGRKFRVAATALGIDKDQLAALTSATPAN